MECVLKENKNIKGVTLVELAVVITIIAILMGGILQGHKVLENARLLREIKNIESFRTATEMFVSAYKQLPGDLQEAHLKIPGCSEFCNTKEADYTLVNGGDYTGDWTIGNPVWNLITFQSYGLKSEGLPPQDDMYTFTYKAYYAETVLFWYELELTGLLSVVTKEGAVSSLREAGFGEIVPAAPLGGGFIVGNSNGRNQDLSALGIPISLPFPALGTVVKIVAGAPDQNTYYVANLGVAESNKAFRTAGIQALKPYQAAHIDRKIDDGLPGSGKIYAYGYQSSCYGDIAPYIYHEGVDSKDCGLIISIYK